jgi:flagellar motor switch/type III secretory pathway protein FliN
VASSRFDTEITERAGVRAGHRGEPDPEPRGEITVDAVAHGARGPQIVVDAGERELQPDDGAGLRRQRGDRGQADAAVAEVGAQDADRAVADVRREHEGQLDAVAEPSITHACRIESYQGEANFLHWAPRRVERIEARVGSAVARWLRVRPGPGTAARLAGREIAVRVVRVGTFAVDPDGAVAVVRGGPAPVPVIGGGGLVRGLAQAILGGPEELAAARPPTTAEQAVWALAVATVLAAQTEGLSVEPSRIAPAMIGPAAALVELAVAIDGIAAGAAWIAVPGALIDRPPPVVPLAALARDRGGWLDDWQVDGAVVLAHAAVARGELDGLRPRDVIVVGAIGAARDEGSLRVGAGEVPVAVAAGGDRVTVRAPYRRGRMDESLGDDLTVELAVSAGTVTVSARKLLELAPGEVLALGRPATGVVELVLGRRTIGTGELIEVDGELAVRVLAVHPR